VSEDPISDPISVRLAPLFQWQKTDDFARQVTNLDEYANDDLLTDGRWKPLREALILRDFAITLGYAECKLCPEKEQFPDAMLRCSEAELQIEITEVLTAGRKRDKEYREFKKNPIQKAISHPEWDEIKEAGSSWVDWTAGAIKKKLKYSKNTKFDIVVYNNINHLFEMPEIARLSKIIGELLAEAGYQSHWVWQCRSTTIDLLWPRVLRLRIPGWEDRF
jgi:hypothetical protein